jgi:hypothetical protein
MVQLDYYEIIKEVFGHLNFDSLLDLQDSFKIIIAKDSEFWYFLTENGYNDFEFYNQDNLIFDLTFKNFEEMYNTFFDDQLINHLKRLFDDKYNLFQIRFNNEMWIKYKFDSLKVFLSSTLENFFIYQNKFEEILYSLMEEIPSEILYPWVQLFNNKKTIISKQMIKIDLRNLVEI